MQRNYPNPNPKGEIKCAGDILPSTGVQNRPKEVKQHQEDKAAAGERIKNSESWVSGRPPCWPLQDKTDSFRGLQLRPLNGNSASSAAAYRDVPGVSNSPLPVAWGLKSVLYSAHRRAAARTLSPTIPVCLPFFLIASRDDLFARCDPQGKT